MQKKYKKNRIILLLIFIILTIFCFYKFVSKGHRITYKLKLDNQVFKIKEVNTRHEKKEDDNYYIEIGKDDIVFNFTIYNKFNRERKVVKDILYYDGNYKCLLPVIDNKAITDFKCYKDHLYYDYAQLRGKDKDLDKYIENVDSKIYDVNDWLDNKDKTNSKDGIEVFTDNLIDNHYISISSLRGIYTINKNINEYNIFSNDIYTRDVSNYIDKYYISADYNEDYEFRNFYLVDITNGKTIILKAPNYVSLDSYIQGIVKNKLYLYDTDNKIQYELNIDNKKIKKIGNERSKIKFYSNNEWTEISTTKADQIAYFDLTVDNIDFPQYDIVIKQGNEASGYYYLIKRKENYYKVYRVSVQNEKIIQYLFDIEDYNDMRFYKNFVYYLDGQDIKYYSEQTGFKTVVHYSELEFNNNLKYGVYAKS